MLSFYDPNAKKKNLEPEYIAGVLGQLDILAGSDRQDKILASRAVEIIRALLTKNGETE